MILINVHVVRLPDITHAYVVEGVSEDMAQLIDDLECAGYTVEVFAKITLRTEGPFHSLSLYTHDDLTTPMNIVTSNGPIIAVVNPKITSGMPKH